MMRVRITQIDGTLPNVALMRLSAWHKSQGDEVVFSRKVERDLFECGTHYDRVYASAIFTYSNEAMKGIARVQRLRNAFPDAIIGGTGVEDWGMTEGWKTLSDVGVPDDFDCMDYSIYPEFTASIGFCQRGCRLKCPFCVVPKKEGKIRSVNTIWDIWRGDPHPRHIHLLDNDFFGQAEWQERSEEIIDGKFKVCFSQGINIRLFNEEQASYIAKMDYRDNHFKSKRIYTAWDNLGDEKRFIDGCNLLMSHGVKANHIMAYMLIGYRKGETMKDILYRFGKMKELGVMPFPMVYRAPGQEPDRTLRRFQRWVVGRFHELVEWEQYSTKHRQPHKDQISLAI